MLTAWFKSNDAVCSIQFGEILNDYSKDSYSIYGKESVYAFRVSASILVT